MDEFLTTGIVALVGLVSFGICNFLYEKIAKEKNVAVAIVVSTLLCICVYVIVSLVKRS